MTRTRRRLLVLAALALAVPLFLRSPGLEVRDGRDDRGKNGVAIGSEWMAGAGSPGDFSRSVRDQRMAEVVIELPPPKLDGTLAALDSARIDALLYECSDARGWVQLGVAQLPFDDPRCRRFFIVDLRRLLDRLPRVRGVMLDLSIVADVSPALLTLLDELRPALAPDARLLGLVMRPWDEPYFREVARRADQVVMPLEISASPFARFRTGKNAEGIRQALAWCEGKPVLIGIPADQRLRQALSTIHLALEKANGPNSYQGLLLQTSVASDAKVWTDFRTYFLKP